MLKAVPTEPRQPKRGEVTIIVRAAGVNPCDYKSYSERSHTSGQGQKEPKFPLSLGVEASGIVNAVGDEAAGPAGPIEIGDEVIACRITGACADSIKVPQSEVVLKPARLTWEQAAALMLTGTTATHVLAPVRARATQTVLIMPRPGA